MIIFRRRLFSIYSIGEKINDEIKVRSASGTLYLRKTSLEKIKSEIFNNSRDSKLLEIDPATKKILAYDALTVDGKRIGIVQLSENSAVDVEFDWINLAGNKDKTAEEYFYSLLEYFVNLARSSRYRQFTLGLYKVSDEVMQNCIDYFGFVSNSEGKIKGITILYKSL